MPSGGAARPTEGTFNSTGRAERPTEWTFNSTEKVFKSSLGSINKPAEGGRVLGVNYKSLIFKIIN